MTQLLEAFNNAYKDVQANTGVGVMAWMPPQEGVGARVVEMVVDSLVLNTDDRFTWNNNKEGVPAVSGFFTYTLVGNPDGGIEETSGRGSSFILPFAPDGLPSVKGSQDGNQKMRADIQAGRVKGFGKALLGADFEDVGVLLTELEKTVNNQDPDSPIIMAVAIHYNDKGLPNEEFWTEMVSS
jgi:hypothetical protein